MDENEVSVVITHRSGVKFQVHLSTEDYHRILRDKRFLEMVSDKYFKLYKDEIIFAHSESEDETVTQTIPDEEEFDEDSSVIIDESTLEAIARQRWSISHGVRTSILSYIYDLTGVKRQFVSRDLIDSRIEKDNNHLMKFIDGINERLNPFSPSIKQDKLYNLSTGATATDFIANFLLNILENCQLLRTTFIEECIADEKNERFGKPIKRVFVENFANLKTKKKFKVGKKVQEVTVQRDLFERLLAIALENKVNLVKVMRYPITPAPTVFCHIDGVLHKTDESV
ncbi:unnamed protein product [Phaedon cochleariae]|uniref:Uncharacterized protein n=1 Tax=Phaedon cochleariae TaxID=80249 RepID=A0A9N9SL78_PHACE|nr:unnamed protein product [Phaedon cochleariae]